MKKSALRFAGVAVMMMFAWSVPGVATAVARSTNGSYTTEYSNWKGISVEDTACDGNDVYSDYKRDSGSPQVWRNSEGCGTTESTVESDNLIARFNSCVDDAGPNTCSTDATR